MPVADRIAVRVTPGASTMFLTDLAAASVPHVLAGVGRLTSVEYHAPSGEWRVLPPDGGAPLFSHRLRQACLDWESGNAAALLRLHATARKDKE